MSRAPQRPSIRSRRASTGTTDDGTTSGLNTGARTPRPYYREGKTIHQDHAREPSGREEGGGSESGTEADDERPGLVRALPAPHSRPRKGLKVGETSEEAFLTPSQLDDEGRRLSQGSVFGNRYKNSGESKAERKKLLRRRLAEFARRSSEVGLMAVMILCVMCGRGVLPTAAQWHRELLAHVAIIATLVLAYPVKLSIVDTRLSGSNGEDARKKLWQRFRVPASFDPATVLYPPLLPVLVALSVSPENSAVILPNIILGLSSLPQRLFPRSSRLGGINALHWLVSILPLMAAENTTWSSVRQRAGTPSLLNCSPPGGLSPETLVSLYPLYHALLQPLQYLTTTSLLVSELHLLSAALINLVLFASSPQAVILKACLWLGGAPLFVFCWSVLHWNVTLARVPRWKLRRHGHTAEERKSFVDAVSELLDLQRATAVFSSPVEVVESDADDDKPAISFKEAPNGRPRINTSFDFQSHVREPTSAVESRASYAHTAFSEPNVTKSRPRRYTLPRHEPHAEAATTSTRKPSNRREGAKSPNLLWCLYLTPDQAMRRKWLYALYVYLVTVVIVLGPVRSYVAQKALLGQDPFGWAIGYLFGQLEPAHLSGVLEDWISWPMLTGGSPGTQFAVPLDILGFRDAIGAANVRLLLFAYWAAVLLAGLVTVFSLTAYVEVDTRRKVFHGVMVAMLLPATFIDPCFCALALALVLAVFLLLEVLRAGHVPPLAASIARFVAPYVDGRDLRGPVVVSHIFLLIGCAVPLWFSLAATPRDTDADVPWPGWELPHHRREVAMVAGVVCVGLGDAAASLIGRRYGRHKWIWVGGKSLEGSAAFAAAVTVGLLAGKAWLVLGGWTDAGDALSSHAGRDGFSTLALAWAVSLAKAAFCACGASFMEAVLTGANDNVVVPVALWLLVKGMRL